MSADWRIEPLSREHLREGFDCGEKPLNEYLIHYARQNQESGVARTFVALEEGTDGRIFGYYSLAAGSISKENLPTTHAKRLPSFPLPVVRLARLAVSLEFQGKGLGEHLLMDALHRCLFVGEEIGLVAVIIDAKTPKAKNFYDRYEFETLPDQDLTLWLPVGVLKKLL